ncbi:hypothetical protein MED01_002437 [Micromonospora sp. MED01]|uniref:hypothetical protein n=1 Tax=Micromonospora alfalfae TaxID=2911212 RepID=UPI001EE843AE|nr:hypothetical protein [Micromonospora alfalfae]MCG5464271.1 hypothetical protein [Micromonospora alfalfae]
MKQRDIEMQNDVKATYGRMDRKEIPYEAGIVELGDIADKHIAAIKAESNASNLSTPPVGR